MKYRQAAYAFCALIMASGVAADARSDAGDSPEALADLSGYWQQEDGTVYHFSQDGINLISRHDGQSPGAGENEIDFTATVHGNLIYGAHRGPFSRAIQKRCAIQIWVGMGLTLSEDGRLLEGFRGDRVVDPKSCSARNSDPVRLVYRRVSGLDPLE